MRFDPKPIQDEIRRQISEGLRPGMHVAVDFRGEVVLDERAGVADADTGAPVTERTLFSIYSAVKPVVALAIHQLVDRGKLQYHDKVVKFIPEFGKHGKEKVTLAHVLTHRGGFPDTIRGGPDSVLANMENYGRVLEIIYETPLAWEPGEARGYHGLSGWYILGELVHRITGKNLDQYVREELALPCGASRFYFTVPDEEIPNVCPLVDLSRNRDQSVWNNPKMLKALVPGGGGRTSASELVKFFRLMLDGGLAKSGQRILSKEIIGRAVFPHVAGTRDRILGNDVPWGLGFQLKDATKNPGFFGSLATPGTYGHMGHFGVATAFADPGRDVAVAVLTNGLINASEGVLALSRIADAVFRQADAAGS